MKCLYHHVSWVFAQFPCRYFSFHLVEPGYGRAHNSVKDELTFLASCFRLHQPGERNISEKVSSRPALTSDKSGPLLRPKFVSRQTRPVTFDSQLRHTIHQEVQSSHFSKAMASTVEPTTPTDQPRRFLTVEDETHVREASQISTAIPASGASAATEGTTTTSNAGAVEPPPHDIADVVLASRSEHTKPQSMDAATESADAETSHAGFAKRDTHTPSQFSIRSGHGYTSFQRTSPEQVSSIFPTELPPRPPPKQSFLKRLQGVSARPAHTDKVMSHDHTYRTPDIEMAAPSEAPRSHDVDKIRSLKFWLLIMLGICLSSIIGMVIHWAVTHGE